MPRPHDDEPFDPEESFEEDDDALLEREGFATRKANRLQDMRDQWNDALTVGVYGLGLLVGGVGLFWLALASVLRGWLDDGSDIIYAAQEPGWFYGSVAFIGAMGVFMAQLGVRMVRHTRREARRTARHSRRVQRAGTRRP